MTTNKKIYFFGLVLSIGILTTTAIGVGSLLSNKKIKENTTTTYLTITDNGATVSVKKGDQVSLELKDNGDGGYSWTLGALDQTILSLTQRSDSQPSGLMGDFGNDIWVFTAEHPGSTTLNLVCNRPWNTTDTCATFTVQIQVL